MPRAFRNSAKKLVLSLIYRLPPLPGRLRGTLVWVHPRAAFSVTAKTFFRGEAHVQKWLTKYLEPGHVFFDIGAHHGWVSMWALALVGKTGAAHAFEPSPSNLSILAWHKKANGHLNWTLVPKAVSDEDAAEKVFFLIDSGDSPMNSLTTGVPGTLDMEGRNIGKVTVQTTRLDTYCQETGVKPNLVKIDVEGAELLVLRGGRKLFAESCPTIILAMHPPWLPKGQSTGQIFEMLNACGYTVFDAKGKQAESLRTGEYLCLKTEQLAQDISQRVPFVREAA